MKNIAAADDLPQDLRRQSAQIQKMPGLKGFTKRVSGWSSCDCAIKIDGRGIDLID